MFTQQEFSNTWPSAILNIKYINKMSLKLHTQIYSSKYYNFTYI